LATEAAEALDDPNTLAVVIDDGPQDDAKSPPEANGDEPQSSEEAVKVASLMGWKPKDQWKGDTTKWRPAEEFLAEMPDVLRHTRQANSRMKAQIDQVAGLVAKLTANQRRDMDARQEAELDAAVEANDPVAAKKILAEIRANAGSGSGDPPALSSFKERNADWFEVDPEATAYAMALDAQYARLANNKITDPDAHMKRVEAGVKKKFPEHFDDAPKDDPKPKPKAPIVGAGGRVGGSRSPSGDVTVADLTPAQRRGAEESGVSLADYAKAVTKMNQMARRA